MSNDNKKPGTKYVNGQEVDDGQSIEPIIGQEKDLSRAVKEEAFMNEMVLVELIETAHENDAPHVILNVNGRSQPLFRGEPTRIRRCFVEVLARMKETKFVPQEADMQNPMATNTPKGKTGFAYPFTVLEDTNPLGREWLKAVKAEPA